MTKSSLFSEYTRTDHSPARESEAAFDFLDRTSRTPFSNVRRELDDWFQVYPEDAKSDLRGRFQSDRDSAHFGAFFELFLHELLRRRCKAVVVDPRTDRGQTPDFRCIPHVGKEFYVEATLAGEPSELTLPKLTRDVLDLVNSAYHPRFRFAVEVRGILNAMPKKAEVIGPLVSWLDSLNYEELLAQYRESGRLVASTRLQLNGLTIDLDAIPVVNPKGEAETAADRMIGMGPTTGGFLNFARNMRTSIESKGNRYKGLDAPLVVAVLAMATGTSDSDVMEALVGPEAVVFERSKAGEPVGTPTMRRRLDGAWFSPTGPQYRRISGFLAFHDLRPWKIHNSKYRLWKHPMASHQLSGELSFAPVADGSTGRFEFAEGESLGDILDLPSEWPGFTSAA